MSRETVTMPQLGESVVEGTVGKWLKAPGEAVGRFESLLEVMTDKVNTEIPSPAAGVLVEVLVEEGETVKVGTPLAVLEVAEGAPAVATPEEPVDVSAEEVVSADGPAAVVDAGVSESMTVASASGDADALPRGVYSPLVRRLAKEHRINLLQVTGSGAGGRVTKADVLAFVELRDQAAEPASHPVAAAPSTPPLPVEAGDEVITPNAMRRTIARHMSESKQTVPHAWTMMEVDVSQLAALRQARKDAFHAAEGVALTYVPFFIKAVVDSLKQFPHLNAMWQDERII